MSRVVYGRPSPLACSVGHAAALAVNTGETVNLVLDLLINVDHQAEQNACAIVQCWSPRYGPKKNPSALVARAHCTTSPVNQLSHLLNNFETLILSYHAIFVFLNVKRYFLGAVSNTYIYIEKNRMNIVQFECMSFCCSVDKNRTLHRTLGRKAIFPKESLLPMLLNKCYVQSPAYLLERVDSLIVSIRT